MSFKYEILFAASFIIGKQFLITHSHVLRARLKLDLSMASVSVHMYAKSGSIADACLVLIEQRNDVSSHGTY